MSISTEKRAYKNYGECVFLNNGAATIGVTVEVGPRVIYFSLNGKKNVMFEDTDRRFFVDADGYGRWTNYGGHRLWVSPEFVPETYSPDNDPVDYKIDGNVLTLTPPATPFGKQLSVEIVMDETLPAVSVTQRIKNVSDKDSEYAAWSITGLTDGGVCVVPLSNKKTGYLANRVISLWDYTDVNDSRLKFGNDEVRVRQDTFVESALKFGFNNEDGFTSYAVNDQIFVKKVPAYENVRYPDYSCNCEVYTNSRFLECEIIGELKTYAPGEEAVISEKWCLLSNDSGFEPTAGKVREEVGAKAEKIFNDMK